MKFQVLMLTEKEASDSSFSVCIHTDARARAPARMCLCICLSVCLFVSVFANNFDKRVSNGCEYDIGWEYGVYSVKFVLYYSQPFAIWPKCSSSPQQE